MAFNVLFMAHAPDADGSRHRSEIMTGKYRLISVVVLNQDEAIEVAQELAEEKDLDMVLLCPGFTNIDVAEISEAMGGLVGVAVARGDGPSGRISARARQREGYGAH